ncbi:MAG: hypothetical protein EOO06_05510 [Chitinophagaceae bacterium]|nr:MAG: hypothetical protein EOO06_05510 [Chitinophagaceae bacterium]
MEYANNYAASAKHGTLGGLCLVLLSNITGGELLKTVVLAATGAAVSFIISYGMKWVAEKMK